MPFRGQRVPNAAALATQVNFPERYISQTMELHIQHSSSRSTKCFAAIHKLKEGSSFCVGHIGTPVQARRLEARLRSIQIAGQEPKKEYVHMLNCTLSATERTLCCVLENYQTKDGVRCVSRLWMLLQRMTAPHLAAFWPYQNFIHPSAP